MPRRTNTFQEVVAILHRHLAGGAEVEESAMLRNRVTGEEREVDVVIRSIVAGHEMVLAIEATKQKGASPWVEQMIGKHEELPTDRLVLVSERGFSRPARRYAAKKGVAIIEPEILDEPDPELRIVGRLERMWPKGLALTPEALEFLVRKPSGELIRIMDAPEDGLLYTAGGSALDTHGHFLARLFETDFPRFADLFGLLEAEEDREQAFLLRLGSEEQSLRVSVRGKEQPLYLRWELAPEPELHEIVMMQYGGRAVINVSEVQLTHRRFATAGVSYGESMFGGRDTLFVVTENEAGGQLSVRMRGKPEVSYSSGYQATADDSEPEPPG